MAETRMVQIDGLATCFVNFVQRQLRPFFVSDFAVSAWLEFKGMLLLKQFDQLWLKYKTPPVSVQLQREKRPHSKSLKPLTLINLPFFKDAKQNLLVKAQRLLQFYSKKHDSLYESKKGQELSQRRNNISRKEEQQDAKVHSRSRAETLGERFFGQASRAGPQASTPLLGVAQMEQQRLARRNNLVKLKWGRGDEEPEPGPGLGVGVGRLVMIKPRLE